MNSTVVHKNAGDQLLADEINNMVSAINSKPDTPGGPGNMFPVAVADTSLIPFNRMLSVIADHTVTGTLVLSPQTTGAVAGCGAIQRIIADGISPLDISAFKKLSISGSYSNVARKVNTLMFFYDGTDYNIAITQNGTLISPAPGAEIEAWVARLAAAGYTIPAERKTAYSDFINTLKDNGIYDLIAEMWMIEGGSAATAVLGFKNYRNGVLHGTVTHSQEGMEGDGISGYMDLGISGSAVGMNDIHWGLVTLNDTCNPEGYIMATEDGSYSTINIRPGQSVLFQIDGASQHPVMTSARARMIMVKKATNFHTVINGQQTISSITDTNPAAPSNIFALAGNNTVGGANSYSNQKLAFISLGHGLSTAQSLIFDEAIAVLHTAIGR